MAHAVQSEAIIGRGGEHLSADSHVFPDNLNRFVSNAIVVVGRDVSNDQLGRPDASNCGFENHRSQVSRTISITSPSNVA